MDDMKKGVPPQNGCEDSAQQGNPFYQHQGFPGGQAQSGGFPGGWAQFAGFPGGWGCWPYGGHPGGMSGAAEDMRMGHKTPTDGEQSWEMPENDSLMGLLLQSNNGLSAYLYASKEVEAAVFSGLSDDERNTLKEILKKLLASWSEQGQNQNSL